jgi:ribonuclease P/MRP protein subunit POP5
MNRVPVRDGKNCVFRVVRVSGTIRKAQEELVRRAREMMLKAQRELDGQGDATLESIFGKGEGTTDTTKDVEMADNSDTEEEDAGFTDSD